MLDIKYIRENAEFVQKECLAKNFKVDIASLLKLDLEIKELRQEVDALRTKRNSLSKSMAQSQSESIKQEVQEIKKQMDLIDPKLLTMETEFKAKMLLVAQPAADDVPMGATDAENVQIQVWGSLPEFGFEPKSHIELGAKLGILDFERGVKLSGSRSYLLKGDGALLEQALLRFSYDYIVGQGYTPFHVPTLVNESVMEGTGYFPIGRDQAYLAERDQMSLVGTAEVSLCGLHADEILDEASLPLKYMAQSTCYRREAGTYGKDTKGLYRVHQFNKIEMVVFAPADKELSFLLHNELLNHAQFIVESLKLPYRVVYVCKGDLGQGQVRKHDIETWMPSRNNYGETHSCSTFYDFQARRLGIKYKKQNQEKSKNEVVYTLNNTLCAAPRLLIAIMENYQTADGHIKIPDVLIPYMNGKSII